MKNKALNPYVNDIIAIAGANDVSFDGGANMFLANAAAGRNEYPGADHLDWGEVAQAIGPISDEARADMLNTFVFDYRANMSKVIAAREAGDYGKAVEIMANA